MRLLVEVEGAEQTVGSAALHDVYVAVLKDVLRAYAPGGESVLDLYRKRQQRVEFSARQIVSGKLVLAQISARRADPAGVSIVGPGADSAVGMLGEVDPHSPAVRRLGKDLKRRVAAQPAVAFAIAGRD